MCNSLIRRYAVFLIGLLITVLKHHFLRIVREALVTFDFVFAILRNTCSLGKFKNTKFIFRVEALQIIFIFKNLNDFHGFYCTIFVREAKKKSRKKYKCETIKPSWYRTLFSLHRANVSTATLMILFGPKTLKNALINDPSRPTKFG